MSSAVAKQPDRSVESHIEPLTWRPLGPRAGAAVIAVMAIDLWFAIYVIWGHNWIGRIVAAALGVVAVVPFLRRAFRIELIVAEDQIRVTNFWRHWTIAWADIATIGWGELVSGGFNAARCVAFEVRGHKRLVRSHATRALSKKQREELVDALRVHAAAHDVRFDLTADDLRPYGRRSNEPPQGTA